MNFAQAAKNASTIKLTENGAMAYNTLDSALMSLFGTIGALRPRSENDILFKFHKAFNEDPLLATKMLFYAGNIRGGLGERRTFRVILHDMAILHPDIIRKNIENIPWYNRWDSLFELVNTPCEADMWAFIKQQLKQDLTDMKENKPISLLAKWMPSINTSSKKTRELAAKAVKNLGLGTERVYRKTLSKLREYLKVIERDMSGNAWENIVYRAVPSKAMMNYSNAFKKHDEIRFTEYMEDVRSGKEKVNASVLFPYELVKDCLYTRSSPNLLLDEQWKALPNYVDGENNFIIMADVSGSMQGRPMETSVGLAIYFAERNKGYYHNLYMTFTDYPHFVKIEEGTTLKDKVWQVSRTDVGYSTDLKAAFDYVLKTAVQNKILPEDMPKAIIVISDMEIDRYMNENSNHSNYRFYKKDSSLDFVEIVKESFKLHGYELPKLIMWNVEARQDTFLSKSDDIYFVSGQSPSVFKALIKALNGQDANIMLSTLNDPIYDRVEI